MFEGFRDFVFGKAPTTRIPERIRQSIAAQQQQSEILIGWIQLAVVMIFATFYTLAPKTGAQADFQPVPFAIGAYAVFNVGRLLAAYRNYIPQWLLIVSVVVDIALLMFLIWSFHIQYEQPASFYLKAPTLMYVFIFIALRTLRFEPRYILWAGFAAVAGWSAMAGYVLFADPENPMVTRNYVEYLTSNAVLIGAEVDKILSIIAVTFVLFVAAKRARNSLNRAVVESAAAEDLSRFVSRQVAERITTSDDVVQPGYGEQRYGTVVFTDIEGFSSVSEKLTPTELAQALNDYFEAADKIIQTYGGVITQFQGDLMLITFNAVTPDDNHALNALKTATGIRELTQSKEFGKAGKFKTRCGINTGEIVVGAIGSHERLSFTVHGDQVNVAARLEQLNKEYDSYILAGENTVAECKDAFRFNQVGEVTVRGRATPTRVFTVEN